MLGGQRKVQPGGGVACSSQFCSDARGNAVYRQVLMGMGSPDGKRYIFFFVFFSS